MNTLTKRIGLIGVFIVSLLATACATAPLKLPDKYNFDNKLQVAKGITSYKIDSWESIDYQSLIIRTDDNDYYLLILQQPAPNLTSSENIGATITVNDVRPGYDTILVENSGGSQQYVIQKMYKLKDNAQANEIRKQILNSK